MRIFIEEKEIVVTIGSKISELSSSRDILDLESLRFAGVKIKDLNNLKIRSLLIFGLCLISALFLSTVKCLMDSQADFLSLMYFRSLLLLALELFSISFGPPNFLFIPAPASFGAPCPSGLDLGGPVSSHL